MSRVLRYVRGSRSLERRHAVALAAAPVPAAATPPARAPSGKAGHRALIIRGFTIVRRGVLLILVGRGGIRRLVIVWT
ncbi:MAG: hypothetical protein ACRDJC_13595, partial [Thermomicrobiales bacterium]